MSEPPHLKCPCQNCGSSIEFPAEGIGAAINCPHCGETTTLFAPLVDEISDHPHVTEETSTTPDSTDMGESNDEPAKPKNRIIWVSLLGLMLLAVAVAFVFKERLASRGKPIEDKTTSSAGNLTPQSSTNAIAATTNPAPAVTARKSIDDLKVGAITLEKSKGSSLVYAVGVLRNDSDHQRFGVTIELALSDARGNKAGTAKDYRNVIEPRREWRFRALVLDSKAVSANVSAIREEE